MMVIVCGLYLDHRHPAVTLFNVEPIFDDKPINSVVGDDDDDDTADISEHLQLKPNGLQQMGF